jgi:hypothetical protein
MDNSVSGSAIPAIRRCLTSHCLSHVLCGLSRNRVLASRWLATDHCSFQASCHSIYYWWLRADLVWWFVWKIKNTYCKDVVSVYVFGSYNFLYVLPYLSLVYYFIVLYWSVFRGLYWSCYFLLFVFNSLAILLSYMEVFSVRCFSCCCCFSSFPEDGVCVMLK